MFIFDFGYSPQSKACLDNFIDHQFIHYFSQLTAIRSRDALEKEHIRRDYDRMQNQLEGISKEQNQVKASKKVRFFLICNCFQFNY